MLFFDRLACKARRRSWMVGRAVLCAPHDGSATLIPKSDGGQRSGMCSPHGLQRVITAWVTLRGTNALEKKLRSGATLGICPISYAGQNMPVRAMPTIRNQSKNSLQMACSFQGGRASGIA